MSKFTGNIIRLPAVTPTQNSASGVYTLDDQFTAQSSGTWPIVRDQYFNYTTLLLTGAVQGTAYPNPVTQPYSFLSDASTNNFVVSPNGDVSARPFNPYLNNYSNYFDGTANGSLRADSTADTNLSGDFTIQAWVFPTANGQSSNSEIISRGAATTLNGWRLGLIASTTQLFFGINYASSGNTSTCTQSSTNIPLNQWTYVAVTRSGNTCRIYINGVLDTTNTGFTGTPTVSGTEYVYVGRGSYDTTNRQFTGYVTNASIIKGTALTTFNQTQPLATGTSGQALLTCTANRFIDTNTATTAKLLTVGSGASVSQNSPFVSYDTTNGSGYFDGTGDFLSLPTNTATALGSSNFTAEAWVYPNGAPSSPGQIIGSWDGTTTLSWTLNISPGGAVVFGFTTTGNYDPAKEFVSGNIVTPNAWNHIAAVRTSNTIIVYVNGVVAINQTMSGTVYSAPNNTKVGSNGQPQALKGYITDARLVVGSAVYSGTSTTTPNFTLPTSSLQAITNTQLLTCQTRAPATNNGFIDSSPNNFVVTRNGNTTQGSFSPFSLTGWANYFDGTTDYLSIANNAALQLSNSTAWTVELWFYATALSSEKAIYNGFNPSGSPNYNGFGLNLGSNGQPATTLMMYDGTNWTNIATVSANQWYHVAVSYEGSGTTRRCFLNGVLQGSAGTVPSTITNTSTATAIGALSNGNFSFPGYISNVRVVKGQALYTGAFTPATSALTVSTVGATGAGVPTQTITGTVSLLTCQSNRFVDNSPNNFTVTKNGDTSVQAFSPFAPAQSYIPSQIGGSGYFDGTGDYLTAPSNIVDFAAGQAFTVECWVYVSSISTSQAITASGANTFSFAISGGQVLYGKSGVIDLLVGTMAAANQWVHIAVGRNSSNTSRLWVNGTSVATSGSDTYSFNAATMYIGSNSNPAAYLNGYMASLRVVKGTDVYGVANTTITVPTAPLTAIPNTSLLLNFTNGGIVDATGKNNLETVANSGVQTSQAKWSPGSMYFDGTTDYLKAPTSELWNLGSGDFAVEFFIRFNSIGAASNAIVGKWGSGAGTYAWIIQINSSQLTFYTGNNGTLGSQLTFAWTPSANIWYFVAVSRTSGNIRAYVDTNQIGTTQPNSHTLSSTAGLCAIGENLDGGGQSQFINGYLDDLRITRGYNRGYSGSTITVPTGPFPLG